MLRSAIYSEGFIGHHETMDRIASLVENRRLPHALLLSGPDGVGKSLAARWVAAAHLCENGGCGTCPACSRVLKSLHPDVHMVKAEEGKRDITIRQIRELLDAVSIKPFEAGGKVALIDDADRMNEESQNAFLKTLEEPPPDTVVALVSSRPERLLPTIRSRCQRFRFHPLNSEEMERFMAGREGMDADFPGKLAEGSPGRLMKYIEAGAGQARKLFIDYITSRTSPSPVKGTGALMAWAKSAERAGLKQVVRERLALSLHLGAALFRDLAALKEEAGGCHLLNEDIESDLREAACLYEPSGIFLACAQMVEAAEDIAGYVDPGLAVENVFRVIREIRK